MEFLNFLTNASTRQRPQRKFFGMNEGPLARSLRVMLLFHVALELQHAEKDLKPGDS